MNDQNTSRKRSILPLCGIAGPAIIGLGALVSALAYVGRAGEHYSPLNHFVSELGELGVSDLAAVFNGGLFIGGILTTCFMVYLALQLEHWMRYPLGILSLIAAVCGALVGVYPMNLLEPHIRVALAFFNLGMLISFLYSFVFLFSRRHPFPRWLAIPGFLNAAAFTLFLNYPSDFDAAASDLEGFMQGFLTDRPDLIPLALLEWVVVLGILVWILLLGIYLFTNGAANAR